MSLINAVSPIIKVCGLREADNIRAVDQLLAARATVDTPLLTAMMGFIFWEKSSRYVGERPAYLPKNAKRVGVFVDASLDVILQKAEDFGLDFIQLHGHESPIFIRALRDKTYGSIGVIKAFNLASAEDLELTRPYTGLADYFLFDTKGKSVGGNGEKFDWSLLDDYDGETPFLLSGGIGPDDAERVLAFRHPRLAGIDLNSRFETAPAQKDINALRRFLNDLNCKSYNCQNHGEQD